MLLRAWRCCWCDLVVGAVCLCEAWVGPCGGRRRCTCVRMRALLPAICLLLHVGVDAALTSSGSASCLGTARMVPHGAWCRRGAMVAMLTLHVNAWAVGWCHDAMMMASSAPSTHTHQKGEGMPGSSQSLLQTSHTLWKRPWTSPAAASSSSGPPPRRRLTHPRRRPARPRSGGLWPAGFLTSPPRRPARLRLVSALPGSAGGRSLAGPARRSSRSV